MFVIISYDVATDEGKGQRRLRRVARACKDFGQRVQYSVFECIVDPAQWTMLKNRLISEIDPKKDSQKMGIAMADYMGSKNLIMPSFQEGFGLLEIIDRNLNRYSQSADQRVSTSISLTAITVSIIIALLK